MLKSMHLSNFQSHKQSTLEFDPGVNVIIGPSDSGKTAIIRALRWLVWNRPSGDAFRSTWGGDTKASILIENCLIGRGKGKQEEYFLEDTNFKAFGKEVPEEITKTLNLNDVNLQSQLDSPFLLSNSPGEVAKHFNRVAHLDQIDEGLSKVQKWIREIDQDISSSKKQVIGFTEDLLKFEHLEKFEVDVEVLEGMETQMIQQVNNKRTLERLCLDSYSVKGLIEKQEKITEAGPLVDTILNWHIYRCQFNSDKVELEGLIAAIKDAEEDLEDESKILGAEESVNGLVKDYEQKQIVETKVEELDNLIEDISSVRILIDAAEQARDTMQIEFDEIFPETCPLCGKPK